MKGDRTSSMETFGKVMRVIGRYKILLVLSIVLAAFSVILQLYVPILFGDAIDGIIAKGKVDFGIVSYYLARILVLIILSSAATWVMNMINNRMTYRVVRDIRAKAIRRVQVLPLSYLDAHKTGDIVSRVIADVDQLSDGLLLGFTQLFTGVVTIVATLIFMFSKNVAITLLVVVMTPLSFFVAKFIADHSYVMFRHQTESRGEQTALIEEMVGSAKVVKAFGYEKRASERFAKVNGELKEYSQKATFFSSLTNPATRFVNSLIYALVALVGAFVILGGGLTVGGLSVMLSYANQYMKPFNDISSVVTELQNALACATRIFALIEEEPEKDCVEVPEETYARPLRKMESDGTPADSSERTREAASGGVCGDADRSGFPEQNSGDMVSGLAIDRSGSSKQLHEVDWNDAGYEKTGPMACTRSESGKNVSAGEMPESGTAVSTVSSTMSSTGTVDIDDVFFSYVKDHPLIENYNLHARPGMRVAIVGPTGCGKTTMINLLMRFYDADKGDIRVDGESIYSMPRHELRQHYGMVLQDTWLKNGTVRDNINIGKPDATDEEIIAAAKEAHSWEFIRRLPQKLDTVLNEDSLSQGQKQLLCITRVMLKLPPMLILDEATSSIDTRTEILIQQAFDKLMEGRTSFIVAHRLSTIRSADIILVMKDGKIIEQGNHESLLKAGGFYAKLYNSQFSV
ncbi:MAG: ABC transporter ATP-binding protein [Chordicoccus sp.]